MIIRHTLPTTKYTKVDRGVFGNNNITDGACRLYGFLCGLRNGSNFSDAYIMKALNWSKTMLHRRKKELSNHGLLLVDRIGPKMYIGYIGYSGFPAKKVKDHWVDNEDVGNLGEK